MFICRHSEGVHAYLLKCCRGTYSSVGMLKGYMVRESLGIPGLQISEWSTAVEEYSISGFPSKKFSSKKSGSTFKLCIALH